MEFDLKVTSERVVTPHGPGAYDIYIRGGTIVAVVPIGAVDLPARRVVDASGLVVAPGGIEAHSHISMPIPQVPSIRSQGPGGASRAGLFGGTTTIIDFAVMEAGVGPMKAVDAKHAEWSADSYADYALRCTVVGAPSREHLLEAVELAGSKGVPSFKAFMIGNKRVPDGVLLEFLRLLRECGGLLMIHALMDDMVKFNAQKHVAEGWVGFENLTHVHDEVAEELAIRHACQMAAKTGAAVYFAHVSSRGGLHAVVEARARGLPVYAEVLHNYLAFDESNYREPDGVKYHTYPSLKTGADRSALWDGLCGSDISVLATDDVTTPYELKTRFGTILDARGGHSGLDTRLPFAFSQGVAQGQMSLERFVEVTSSNPAKLFGLYPRKGAIAPGSDADLAIIDPADVRIYHKSHVTADTDYSIWEGWKFDGWPRHTILRGQVAVDDGELTVERGFGRFVPGKIAPAVLRRPAC